MLLAHKKQQAIPSIDANDPARSTNDGLAGLISDRISSCGPSRARSGRPCPFTRREGNLAHEACLGSMPNPATCFSIFARRCCSACPPRCSGSTRLMPPSPTRSLSQLLQNQRHSTAPLVRLAPCPGDMLATCLSISSPPLTIH